MILKKNNVIDVSEAVNMAELIWTISVCDGASILAATFEENEYLALEIRVDGCPMVDFCIAPIEYEIEPMLLIFDGVMED